MPKKSLDIADAKGTDGASLDGEIDTVNEYESVRDDCISELQSLVQSSNLYTENDLKQYVDQCLSDKSLESVGKKTAKEKLEALRENLLRFIPKTASKINLLESTFVRKLTEARQNGWITDSQEREWMKRLSSNSAHWGEKEEFILETFPGWMKNWEQLSVDQGEFNELLSAHPECAKLKEVKAVTSSSYKLLKFEDKAQELKKGLARLRAAVTKRDAQYGEAMSILEAAVASGALAENKIGTWLDRIFKSSADETKIESFITGSGKKSLRGLKEQWEAVRVRFDSIEMKKSEGLSAPRRFHFVSTDNFLNWHYSRRLAYVNEAEKRFEDVNKEHPLLLGIRRELDMRDWESAAVLLDKAERMSMSEADSEKVTSMRKYFVENRPRTSLLPEIEEPTDDEVATAEKENQELIRLVAPGLQNFYHASIKAGKFDCFHALLYNWIWCVTEGHCLDDHKVAKLQETTTDDTRTMLNTTGHTNEFENNDYDGYSNPSVKSYGRGISSPQVLHVSSSNAAGLVATMNAEDCEDFRYWTTLIPRGVNYAAAEYAVKNVNHMIRRNLRIIENGRKVDVRKEKKQKVQGEELAIAG